MLIIRDAQLRALEQDGIRSFERSLIDHAHEFAPHHCKILGDDGVLRVVQFARQRAARAGLTYRGPVRLYLELVFMIGAAFDTDPLLPWAGAILVDPSIDNQVIRAERLYNATNEYLDRVAGPGNAYARNALRALGAARSRNAWPTGSGLAAALVDELMAAYPEKCADVGEPALHAMVKRATNAAQARGLTTDVAYVLFSVLTFIVGHGFTDDPCLPWISHTLDDPRITDPDRRVAHLRSRCSTYLDRALANLDLD